MYGGIFFAYSWRSVISATVMDTMNLRAEIVNRGGGLPMPIAQMGPWFFWARPYALGFPEHEVDALVDGTASPELQVRMQQRATDAMSRLLQAPVNESVRPS